MSGQWSPLKSPVAKEAPGADTTVGEANDVPAFSNRSRVEAFVIAITSCAPSRFRSAIASLTRRTLAPTLYVAAPLRPFIMLRVLAPLFESNVQAARSGA